MKLPALTGFPPCAEPTPTEIFAQAIRSKTIPPETRAEHQRIIGTGSLEQVYYAILHLAELQKCPFPNRGRCSQPGKPRAGERVTVAMGKTDLRELLGGKA